MLIKISVLLVVILAIVVVKGGVHSSNIVISISIDAGNVEVQREAFRLLHSIQVFGGELKDSRIAVCISYDSDFSYEHLLKKLKSYNITSYEFSLRFSLPSYSPTLNKLCSFNPKCLADTDYLLYLDADMFVLSNPLPFFSLLNADILCGRPWNSELNIDLFYNFLDNPANYFSSDIWGLLETISYDGHTAYGMCNTGMYFMRSKTAKRLHSLALYYLNKLEQIRSDNITTYINDSHFSLSDPRVDSLILWAAQYTLGYRVHIIHPFLNYIAAAEYTFNRFLYYDDIVISYDYDCLKRSMEISMGDVVISHDIVTIDVYNETVTDHCYQYHYFHKNELLLLSTKNNLQASLKFPEAPVLVHFSSGSDLTFKAHKNNISNEWKCFIHLKAQLHSNDITRSRDGTYVEVKSYLTEYMLPKIRNYCWNFYFVLENLNKLMIYSYINS